MERKLWLEARVIAARHGGDASEDLAQDLVVAVLEGGDRADNPGAWLERVGRNAAIDRWRVERRREELAPEIEAPVGVPDPETALLRRERRGLVRRALAALPRPQRRAALARFHAELPYEAVGERIGAPPITARTRVHRALANLRARLGDLRALFVLPGAQTAALGLTILVGELPGAPRPEAIVVAEPAGTVAPHRRPPTRIMAAAPVAKEGVPPTSAAPQKTDAREVPAVQKFTFDDEGVLGEVEGPDGEPLRVVLPAAHASLIEIRRHFVPEMLKALEDL